MAKLVPITREQFGGKRWLRFENYRFASHDPVVPLAASEIARAALAMPLAFLQLEGRYTLVAVQSLLPQQNMFVAADGRWLGFYVPALYRGYPFRLLRKPDSDELVLCVDEESGLVVDGTAGGEEFFDKDGNASAVLKSAFEFLVQFERGRKAMEQPVAALAEAGRVFSCRTKLFAASACQERCPASLPSDLTDCVNASSRPFDAIIWQIRRIGGLTEFLYKRDGEIIAFERPDLAVSGTGWSFVAQVVGAFHPLQLKNSPHKCHEK